MVVAADRRMEVKPVASAGQPCRSNSFFDGYSQKRTIGVRPYHRNVIFANSRKQASVIFEKNPFFFFLTVEDN